MPPTKEKYRSQRARVPDLLGAGGEPPGEPPAPPPGILERVPNDIRRQLPDDVVDELLAGAKTEEEIVGPGGLLSQLTKRLVERAMEVELTDHLGYEPHREPPGGAGILFTRRVVEVLHRRLDVGVSHPLLDATNVGLGDHPGPERVP